MKALGEGTAKGDVSSLWAKESGVRERVIRLIKVPRMAVG